MAALPWRSLALAEPERPYVALLTYLPLNSGRRIPWLLVHNVRIMAQLRRSPGLLGYSLYMELMAKRFWTLSAWQDEASLRSFVEARPHAHTMVAMQPHMGATRFIHWVVQGSQLPLGWEDALRRWRGD